MHLQPAAQAVLQGSIRGCKAPSRGRVNTERIALAVESIGYLVPQSDFAGRVHSVFAQTCNIAYGDTLFTLSVFGACDGPTTLRLALGAPNNLLDLFDVGEPIHRREDCMRSRRVEIRLHQASVWWPVHRRPLLPRSRIEARLREAALRLAQWRRVRTSLLDREGAAVTSALFDACRTLDLQQAERHADRLIGWGEGLTPAGDDFLIGLVAGLDAFRRRDQQRQRFRDALCAALARRTSRTTAIAANYLQLAAGGHYTEPLVRLRNAWLCEDDEGIVDTALTSALAIGATSGADTVRGLLAGLLAWLPDSITA